MFDIHADLRERERERERERGYLKILTFLFLTERIAVLFSFAIVPEVLNSLTLQN